MPLFEHRYSGQAKGADGKFIPVPPAVVLRDAGPLLQVAIAVPPELASKLTSMGKQLPQPIAGWALIDTGASVTAVDESVCQKLGLSPTGVITMSHAGGTEQRTCYPIQIHFPGTPLPPLVNPMVVSCNLRIGQDPTYILLFGRDLLARLKMVYNGPVGRIELAF